MDDDISHNDQIMETLSSMILSAGPTQGWTIIPYCVTSNFERWSSR
jgi:hypothetical protein